MFDPSKVQKLLAEQGLNHKDLLVHIGLKPGSESLPKILSRNLSAARVEQIADFFECPLDDLFDRKITTRQRFSEDSALARMIAELETQLRLCREHIADLENDKRFLMRLIDSSGLTMFAGTRQESRQEGTGTRLS